MTERNTNNLDAQKVEPAGKVDATDAGDAVQSQLEANERARKILESQQKRTEAAVERAEKDEEVARGLRGEDKKQIKVHRKTDDTAVMAGVNFVEKPSLWEKNKKIWIGAGSAVVTVVLLVTALVVTANVIDAAKYKDITCDDEIWEKIDGEGVYTYSDAIADCEIVYSRNEDDTRTEALAKLLASLYTVRAGELYNQSINEDTDEYNEQILKDAYAAEKLAPSADTAYSIYTFELLFGDEEKAEEYLEAAEGRDIDPSEQGVG